MNVRFFDENGVEFISIAGGFMGKDEVVREATEDDKRRYHHAYQEFKNPPAAPEAVAAEVPAPSGDVAGLNSIVPATPTVGGIGPDGKVT